jgi:hypothetical protein
VQKFQNRNIYDAAEKEEVSLEVHQDYYHSDTEHVVQEGDDTCHCIIFKAGKPL